ncbi:MAG: hybrid sensor histidine kinase/response regulator transcription factor, partial [Bacteroidales bacterium]
TFWVTGSNNDGVWNTEGTTLEIRIRPPWYRSSLASGTYAMLALLIIAGIIWWRTSRLQKEKLILEAEVTARTRELKQKNEQILEMEQLKTRFFTDVSHEIRTPLSLISGPLDNLIQKEYPDQDTNHWLHIIKRNSKRLMQLVNQLLDISRLDAGRMKLVLIYKDVIRHMEILVQEYYSLAESRSIHFINDIPDRELVAWYDGEKTEKVVTNLLSNAFKYTRDNGIVTFRIKFSEPSGERKHQVLRILVADTGLGIPESERDKIFERFYRSQEEQHSPTGGAGIGLSLTRELLTLMKGDIYVRSLVGKGTVFIVTIPLGKEHLHESEYVLKEEQEPIQPEAMQTDGKSGEDTGRSLEGEKEEGRYELLVIEDNTELRKFIGESLSQQYDVFEAANGSEGFDMALDQIPDLVISDVMMPEMGGMELCKRLKKDQRTSHIPVILLTAKATSDDRIEGLELGADDYISKPFEMRELKVRVKNLLEQRERLKHKYSGMIGMDWDNISVTTLEEKFLKKVTSVVVENMHDSEFNVRGLQAEMAMSRVNLFRKLKALTGNTPSELIRSLRLKAAAIMLEKGNESITHIALDSGFSNSSIFAHAFKKEYGITPREYRKQNKSEL